MIVNQAANDFFFLLSLQALYLQYLHFKESEIPLKENEKTKIKHLYKMLEVGLHQEILYTYSQFVYGVG